MELMVDEVQAANYVEANYSAVIDAHTGVRYQQLGGYPGRTELVRLEHSVQRALSALPGGRIYKDGSDSDTQFSIRALSYLYRGAVQTLAASTNNAMSGGNVAHYVSVNPQTNGLVIATGGWPATPHVRIAVITLSGGAWNWNSVVDHRTAQTLGVTADYGTLGMYQQLDHTANTGLAAADSGKLITNIGTTALVTESLPAAAKGLVYRVICMDTDGIKLLAQAGQTIRNVGSVSASGGYIKSTVIGSTLTLVGISSSEWVVFGSTGTWTIDS